MLKQINNFFVLSSLLIFLLLIGKFEFVPIFIFNVFALISFYFIINWFYNTNSTYSASKLGTVILIYSLFSVAILNAISYYFRGNYFVFSEVDASTYNMQAHAMASKPISESIKYFYSNGGNTEDLGAPLIISTIYRIVESNLMLNFFYILCNVFTAIALFRIGKRFMSIKYAFLSSLTFSISSYVIWFQASGLKETVLVMLIVLFYDQYYKYLSQRRILNIIFSATYLLALLLFRPAIMFFLIGSVIITFFLTRRKTFAQTFFILLLFILFIATSTYIQIISNKFLPGGDTSAMIESKEASGMVAGGSLPFSYSINFISQFAGPLPSIAIKDKMVLSIFSIGLIYRVLISLAFWIGAYYAYKRKVVVAYPLILFIIMEMASLFFILEGLELRKSLSHLPFVFLISFYFFDLLRRNNVLSYRVKKRLHSLVTFSLYFFFAVIIFWNFR